MKNIILTTTASFLKAVEESDLKGFLNNRDIEVFLQPRLEPPFSFDHNKVKGLVVGHNPSGEFVYANPKSVQHFPNLKIVSPFGIGTDHIDFGGLEKIGVKAIKLPHFSKRTVAELTMGFIFDLARRITQQSVAIKNGTWERLNGQNIFGKTLGIVGLGNIGKEVAILARGIGINVLANDIVYDKEFNKKYGIVESDLKELLQKSDFITLHTPLTDGENGTRNLIDKKTFSLMKHGVLFINAARGEIIDDEALLASLESGQVGGAALDVYSKEPPFSDKILEKIVKHPSVISTPHIGAYTPEIRYAIAKKICEEFLHAFV